MNKEEITQTVGLMMRVLRMHRGSCQQALEGMALHPSGHRMLMYLYRKGKPLSQKQLAEHFGISAAAASVTVKKLKSAGYIDITEDEKDHRLYNVSITDNGTKLAECSREIFNSIDAQMVQDISDSELEVFRSVLEKMKDNFERSKQ